MDENEAADAPARQPEGRGVTRRELELVIRRAAELTSAEVASEDLVSEAELIRIAGELGLPAHHVRQALYELSEPRPGSGWLDRHVGDAIVHGVRGAPGAAEELLDRLEHYLTTEEYLRLVRRRGDFASFQPSGDVVSTVARAFRRGGSKHAIGRARRVSVAVRPLSEGRSHVSLDVDLADRRRNALVAGVSTGGVVGAGVGFGLGVLGSIALGGSAPDPTMTLYLGLGGGAAGLGAGVGAGIAGARAWFRSLKAGFRTETEGLLDRVERGDRLIEPAAAWKRKARDYLRRTTGWDWS